MKKEEVIARYGEAEYERRLEQQRAWRKAHRETEKARAKKYRETHPEEAKAAVKKYREEHPEVVIANNQEIGRKGGKHYDKKLEYNTTGLQGERNVIRSKDRKQWKEYKDIIAPDSQIHHEWVPTTSEYRGLALVEANPHRYGIINVIEILDGEITLLTEEEIKKKGRNDTTDL